MKHQLLLLCRLSAYFTRWRLLWLIPAALVAPVLPGVLQSMAMTALILLISLVVLYRRLYVYMNPPQGHRPSEPRDALAETVLIDPPLLSNGTQVRAVCQPRDVSDELTLQLGSGALVLGAAMTLTAEVLPATERLAVEKAVAKLNIVPERMQSYQPVQARLKVRNVHCIQVRDGQQDRCYYLGAPEDVLPMCGRIWDGEIRTITAADRAEMLDHARCMAQGKCRIKAYATCPVGENIIFLGFAGIGEDVTPEGLLDVSLLQSSGLTAMVADTDDMRTSVSELRELLKLPVQHARPDIHLSSGGTAAPHALAFRINRGESASLPILKLRETFSSMELVLQRYLKMALFAALPCLLTGWTMLFAVVLMIMGILLLGDRGAAPLPGRKTQIFYVAGAALALLFLSAAENALIGHVLLSLLTALAAVLRLCGMTEPKVIRQQKPLVLQVVAAAGICLLIGVVASVIAGFAVLPGLFGLLSGTALAALLITGK